MKDSQDYTVRIRFTFSLSFLFARERNTLYYERKRIKVKYEKLNCKMRSAMYWGHSILHRY